MWQELVHWMFDLDFLTNSMNYIHVSVENQVNVDAGTQDSYVAGSSGKDKGLLQDRKMNKLAHDDLVYMIAQEVIAKALDDATRQAFEEEKKNIASQKRAAQATNTNKLSNCLVLKNTYEAYLPLPILIFTIDPNMPDLKDDSDAFSSDGIFNEAYDDENVGAVVDFNNMDDTINVSHIKTQLIQEPEPKQTRITPNPDLIKDRPTFVSTSTSWDQIPTNIATAVICLATNQKYYFSKLIFDGMMRHLDAKKFVMYPRFISLFLTNQLKNVPVPLDHFPINALTPKVFSFMVKKGKKISGNVIPLFPSMLAQPTKDEGAVSERPSKTQPTPSPPHPSADQHETQPDSSPRPPPTIPISGSILEGSGGNHGGQSSSDRSLSGNEDGLTLQSVYDLCVSLCE
ncbi:hypothetical protein Tco_0353471 [Tanacetum coccineum]